MILQAQLREMYCKIKARMSTRNEFVSAIAPNENDHDDFNVVTLMKDRQNSAELKLFLEAMEGVRPLSHDRIVPTPPKPAPIPRQALADEQSVLSELLSFKYDPEALTSGEELMYGREGLHRGILRRLRRGHYSLAAELDLHGMTVPVARQALQQFLLECRRRNLRCVRIIHGKGRRSSNEGPVLKPKVDLWLRQRDDVLAFCSARPTDGGTGAVYVLLTQASRQLPGVSGPA